MLLANDQYFGQQMAAQSLRAMHKDGHRKACVFSPQINFTRLVGAETANKYLASNSLDPLLLPVTIAPCAPGTQPNQAGGCTVVWRGWPATGGRRAVLGVGCQGTALRCQA